jgi:hypothetical protein
MKRESAELILGSIEGVLRYFGVGFERLAAESGAQEILKWMPKHITKWFKYGHDRAGVIKYLMTLPEPSPAELARVTSLPSVFPLLVEKALIERKVPARRRYRSKIRPEDRPKVCQDIKRLRASTSFARAIEEVAAEHHVHTRTIRRIWEKDKR